MCVQPMLESAARKSEDLTTDKPDDKDAVLIPRPDRAGRRWHRRSTRQPLIGTMRVSGIGGHRISASSLVEAGT